jgi:hypothetical protein
MGLWKTMQSTFKNSNIHYLKLWTCEMNLTGEGEINHTECRPIQSIQMEANTVNNDRYQNTGYTLNLSHKENYGLLEMIFILTGCYLYVYKHS